MIQCTIVRRGMLFLVVLTIAGTLVAPSVRKSPVNATPVSHAKPEPVAVGDLDQRSRIAAAYNGLPLSFETNEGQSADEVKFLARGRHYTLFLTATEAVMTLQKSSDNTVAGGDERSDSLAAGQTVSAVVRIRMLGSNPNADVVGLGEMQTRSNYFMGSDPQSWIRDVPHYANVHYQDAYPGVDVIYYGHQGGIECDFVVRPGADPDAIQLSFEGATGIHLNERGDLVLTTDVGEIHYRRPVAYQETRGVRQPISATYVLSAETRVGINVGEYDVDKPLLIDPVIQLEYSTYLGGMAEDIGHDIVVDDAGHAYVTGLTYSSDFADSPGVFQPDVKAAPDVFVTKLNLSGSTVIYSTYLGGSGYDVGSGIAVDDVGNVYVTGTTCSGDFPVTEGFAFQPEYAGGSCAFAFGIFLGSDAFVTKLNPSGSALVYSTYLGGSLDERGFSIDVDDQGHAFVTGLTSSTTGFPIVNALQQTYSGGLWDAFVTKVDPSGSELIFSTYLGGTGTDYGLGVSVDGAGWPHVTGTTSSNDYPVTTGAFQMALEGSGDAFVTKFHPSGTPLAYSTYLGGSATEEGSRIDTDGAGNAYVTGTTASGDFPLATSAVNDGPYQTELAPGGTDAFVAKISSSGSQLVYSTYLGGDASDAGLDIAVDGSGSAYVTGFTFAPSSFPILNAVTNGGGQDAFVAKMNPSGTMLVYSTYLGGEAHERGHGIDVTENGVAFVTGVTSSSNFPTTTNFALMSDFGGFTDAFVARIGPGTRFVGPWLVWPVYVLVGLLAIVFLGYLLRQRFRAVV